MTDTKTHNDALAKLIAKNLKKDLANVETQRQGYKGTGSKSYKRQIFLRSTTGEAVDVWLDDGRVEVGGVHVNAGSTAFRVADRTPEESYKELVTLLRTRGF